MNWRKVSIVFVLIFALIFLAYIVPSNAAEPELDAGYFVRVPTSQAAKVIGLNLSPHIVIDYGAFQWLELNKADFDKLSASNVLFTHIPDAGNVQVVAYMFDPLVDGEPDVSTDMRTNITGYTFRLIQFVGPVQDAWLTAMEKTGLPPLQYYPHNSYLTWASQTEADSFATKAYVRWQGVVQPAYKVDPILYGFEDRIDNVDIMFYNDDNVKATLTAITDLGGNILQHYPSQPDKAFYNAIVELDVSAVDDIAKINTVLWLGYSSPEPILDDEMSSQIVAGNYTAGVPFVGYQDHLTNLGVDGSGVTWAVIDTGVDYAHPDLNTRIVGGYTYPGAPAGGGPGDDCSGGGHGTHVAGILGGDASVGFADGDGFLYGLGVAPGYSIFASNSLCAPSWPPIGGWQEHSKQAVLGGAMGGNNSWTTSEGTQHGYQASERTHDIIVLDGNFDTLAIAEPFIEVFSAGNSGGSGLTAPKEAKNLIVTASSQNYRAGNIDTLANSSSVGPAVDGRWVPTIAAPGVQIASTHRIAGASQCGGVIGGTSNYYSWCSGTSMAAPQTSGVIALATEWWRGFNSNADPSPAMAKALVVNGAIDMGTADIPNVNEGWGRVNITNIVSPTAITAYYDHPIIFSDTGQQWRIDVGVTDPSQPLKITLAWADAPGAAGANPALVNNLDLAVVNGGNTYLGNVFSSGWSGTGGSADVLNNLENVYIENPGSSASITIDATNIAGDAILYNGDLTDQSFALVCSNCALFSDFTLSASPTEQTICIPDNADFDIEVGNILGFNDPVTLNAYDMPSGYTASFDTNSQPAPFTSTLTLSGTVGVVIGSYDIDIVGVSPTSTHTTTVQLNLNDGIPSATTLVSPANGAAGVDPLPTFEWAVASQGNGYYLEVATDINFTNIVYSATTSATSHTISSELNTNTFYYWRVQTSNGCGLGSFSQTFSFVTESAPGDCFLGTDPVIQFEDDFESGAGGWTHNGTGDTWQLSTARPHSGTSAYHAADVSSISDQNLVSPAVVLPTNEGPLTLQFWNHQTIEDNPPGCYDGAILEISTNGGGSWTQLESELMTDPYNGVVSSSYNNPLAGLNAWCGDPQDWLNSIVDLDAYAGQSVQFRFRLGTDGFVSREGWYVDDVVVQSCQATGPQPNIAVDPTRLSSEQVVDTIVTQTLTISNTGTVNLDWFISEASDTACTVPGALPWLTVDPMSGTVISNTNSVVDVTFDSTGVEPGPHTGSVCIASNDSGSPNITVPVTLTVPIVYGVDLSDDNSLNGSRGEVILYTVQVTNTGNVQDVYTLTVASEWSADHAPTMSLLPNEVGMVPITVTIPLTVTDGLTDTISLLVVSQADMAVAETHMATITAVVEEFLIYLPAIMKP